MISWLRAAMMLLSMGASSLLLRTEKENEIKVQIVIAILNFVQGAEDARGTVSLPRST